MAPASGTVSIEPGSAEGRHFLIIESREHEAVADDLLRGATAALQQAGATWDVVSTPGVFEIPAAIAIALDTQPEDYDGFVALGGNSANDPLILEQSTRALMDLSITEALALRARLEV